MYLNTYKKLFTLGIIILLIISFNYSFISVADLEENSEDGVAFDLFENDDDIILNNCLLKTDEGIVLEEGTPKIPYDYKQTPENVKAWYHNGLLSHYLQKNPKINPGNPLSDINLTQIGEKDDDAYFTEGLFLVDVDGPVYNPYHHFRFEIPQDLDQVDTITISWYFGDFEEDAYLDKILVYLWYYDTIIEKWYEIEEINYNQTNIDLESGQPDFIYSFTGQEYVSEDGYLDILIKGEVEANPESNPRLYTDYIGIEVESTYGYIHEGTVKSKNAISPVDFSGWEKIFWESSEPKSSITMEVLDKNGNEISGFSSDVSPLDISGVAESEIKLKATLKSFSPDHTPILKEWGVTWHLEDSYHDSFITDYRIEEMVGIKSVDVLSGEELIDKKLQINELYSDWPLFGKTASNIRSYSGDGLSFKPSSINWYSGPDIGGGFRNPVTSDGKVYVASLDGKVYSFNITSEKTKKSLQLPFDSSDELLTSDSSLAITNDFIIVATNELRTENKIYALDKSDLKNEIWNYSYETGMIGYAAAPVVDDGKLFITSWNSRIIGDTYTDFINDILSGNNKLICIDVSTGSNILDPIDLPAASFSAPAVGDELVYAGCHNKNGPSIFAYNIDTGTEIWNQSVGAIGKSSPIYADGKVFVLSRINQTLSNLGENRLIALDALTGDILWNKRISVGSNLLNILRGVDFYYNVAYSGPISTPAYHDGDLFVMAPNGTIIAFGADGSLKSSFSLLPEIGFIDNSFYVSSPVVVDDVVYVVTGDARIFALKFEYDVFELIWQYQIENIVEAIIQKPPTILSSPIVSAGLIFISTTDTQNFFTTSGRMICLGSYRENSRGSVVSSTIHLPMEKWWNRFNADNSTGGTVTFNILDENDVVLKSGLNGNNNDISDVKTNVIKLQAILSTKSGIATVPTLEAWSVNWTVENEAPRFKESTFKPNPDGWINTNIPECSIEVQDIGDNGVLSGINVDSGEYRIQYIPSGSDTAIYSDWLKASSEDSSGVTNTKIIAKLAEAGLAIGKLINITFRVEDLARNSNESSVISFKLDTTKPESEIINKASYQDSYNQSIEVVATASDPGNESGIDLISLIYQFRNSTTSEWSDWIYYENKTGEDYSWSFGEIDGTDLESGYYKILTTARDNANNIEDRVEANSVSFFLDLIAPSIENDFDDEILVTLKLPSYKLEISDDFELDELYYLLDSVNEWVEIKSSIGSRNDTIDWALPEELWAEIKENETRYIFFRVTDSAGNEFQTTKNNTAAIRKDPRISELNIDLSDFSNVQWDEEFEIDINLPDGIQIDTVELQYIFSENKANLDEDDQWIVYGEVKESGPYSWKFITDDGNGYYKFRTRVTDTSGAVYISESDIVNVAIIPGTPLLLLSLLAFILIVLTIVLSRKMKKKKTMI